MAGAADADLAGLERQPVALDLLAADDVLGGAAGYAHAEQAEQGELFLDQRFLRFTSLSCLVPEPDCNDAARIVVCPGSQSTSR